MYVIIIPILFSEIKTRLKVMNKIFHLGLEFILLFISQLIWCAQCH